MGAGPGNLRLSLFNIGGASVIIYSHTPGRNLMARFLEHDGFVFSSRRYILGGPSCWDILGIAGVYLDFLQGFFGPSPPVMPPDRFSAKSCKALGLLDGRSSTLEGVPKLLPPCTYYMLTFLWHIDLIFGKQTMKKGYPHFSYRRRERRDSHNIKIRKTYL